MKTFQRLWTFTKAVLTLATLSTLLAGNALCQSADFRENILDETKAVLDRIQSYVASKSSGVVWSENQSIDLQVTDSFVPGAWALINESGRHVIRLTNEFTIVLMYLTETEILAETRGEYECNSSYMRYVAAALSNIAESISEGTAAQEILAPEVFGDQNGGACTSLHKYYPFPTDLSRLRTKSVASNLEFVYLHELAHHVLHHTSDKIPNIDSGSDQAKSYLLQHGPELRAKETAADLWAVDRMFEFNDDIVVINPPLFTLFIASSGFDPETEKLASHPLGLRRELAILNRHREDYLKKYGSYSRYPEKFDQLRTGVEALEAKAEAEYSNSRKECSECSSGIPSNEPRSTEAPAVGGVY